MTVESVRGTLRRARATFRATADDPRAGIFAAGLGFMSMRRVLGRLGNRIEAWAGAAAGRAGAFEQATVAVIALVLAPAVAAPPAPATDVALPDSRGHHDVVVAPAWSDSPSPTTARPVGPRASEVRDAQVVEPSTIGRTGQTAVEDEPVDGWHYTFTPSPSYAEDHTVFASGTSTCNGVACAAVYRSDDGGATWQRLPAQGVLADRAGTVLVSPAYPDDPRLFFATAADLSVSDDGGRTFRFLTPAHGTAVMSPAFADGDARILFGAFDNLSLGTEYDASAGVLRPLSLSLPVGVSARTFAFAPSYGSDRRMLVGGVRQGREGLLPGYVPTVYSCVAEKCTPVLEAGTGPLPPTVAWTPQAAFAFTSSRLYRSVDGGRSFVELALPGRSPHSSFVRVAVGKDGRLLATVPEEGRTRLHVSEDLGDSWSPVEEGAGGTVDNVVALPDGRLLAGGALEAGGGIRCSVDGGRTWAPRCPPATG